MLAIMIGKISFTKTMLLFRPNLMPPFLKMFPIHSFPRFIPKDWMIKFKCSVMLSPAITSRKDKGKSSVAIKIWRKSICREIRFYSATMPTPSITMTIMTISAIQANTRKKLEKVEIAEIWSLVTKSYRLMLMVARVTAVTKSLLVVELIVWLRLLVTVSIPFLKLFFTATNMWRLLSIRLYDSSWY